MNAILPKLKVNSDILTFYYIKDIDTLSLGSCLHCIVDQVLMFKDMSLID